MGCSTSTAPSDTRTRPGSLQGASAAYTNPDRRSTAAAASHSTTKLDAQTTDDRSVSWESCFRVNEILSNLPPRPRIVSVRRLSLACGRRGLRLLFETEGIIS